MVIETLGNRPPGSTTTGTSTSSVKSSPAVAKPAPTPTNKQVVQINDFGMVTWQLGHRKKALETENLKLMQFAAVTWDLVSANVLFARLLRKLTMGLNATEATYYLLK